MTAGGGGHIGCADVARGEGDQIDTHVSVVIPAYNEEDRLPGTLDRLVEGLPGVVDSWEIVVSDDGSSDATVRLVEQRMAAEPRLRIVSNDVNKGKGSALVAGALDASNPWVLFLDADLPVPVDTIPAMFRVAAGADLVVGSRRMPGSSFHPPQPVMRRLGGTGFRAAVAALGYQITSDPQCGVKLLNAERLGPMLVDVQCSGFAFDVELIERARRAGLRVEELPVAWSHVPGSSLRPVRDAVVTLSELVGLRSRLPSREPVVI